MKQERIEKQKVSHKDEEIIEPAPTKAATTNPEALKSEMDEILDEIDSVLEKNAEEFVKGYIQKGGE